MTPVRQYFAKTSTHFNNEDARVIGPVLGSLAERGPVTARDVVEAAKSTNSPLHSYFEWDDAKAAEMHRLGVGREMIRNVRVRVVSSVGSQRGLAAQPISVHAAEKRPTHNAFVQKHTENDDVYAEDDMGKRSLDKNYYPDDLDEACDLIDDLRERVNAILGENDTDGRDHGMTTKEATIYRLLKNKSGVVRKEQIYHALYGPGSSVEPKIIDVFICKLRPKLPPGEEIETVWGEGYEFVQTVVGSDDAPKRRFTDHAELDPENVIGLPPDNPAVVEKRTLFPSTVIDPKDSPNLLISGANSRKLGGSVTKGPWAGFPIYQLSLEERATCPTTCHHWLSCYGNGMQFARRHKNNENLLPYLRAELTDLQDEYPNGFVVRLHVLGDFFSVDYVDAWINFLEEFPALHIFGYTAWPKDSDIGAAILEYTKHLWDRFAIRFSSEEPQAQGATTIWRMPEDDRVWEGIVCPAQTGKTDCCGSCGLCWAASMKDTPIAFIAHGRTKKPMEDRPIAKLTAKQLMRGR